MKGVPVVDESKTGFDDDGPCEVPVVVPAVGLPLVTVKVTALHEAGALLYVKYTVEAVVQYPAPLIVNAPSFARSKVGTVAG